MAAAYLVATQPRISALLDQSWLTCIDRMMEPS